MNVSMTIVGLIAALLGYIAKAIGWQGETVSEQQLQEVITILLQIGGLLVAYWGRYRKGDINWWGARKTPNITIDSLPQ